MLKEKIKSLKPDFAILIVIFLCTLIYSFFLAYKRYDNFEYGKFDLGNMAQIVYNTSRGRFMEVTDQFGTNMPRWGMSHVDPILALFAPLFLIFAHPMLLVFFQHILVISAIFPLYWLIKQKINSSLTGFLVVLTYVLYPANGFTLIWTGFHGISFVAPLFIWIVWLLEKNKFFVGRDEMSEDFQEEKHEFSFEEFLKIVKARLVKIFVEIKKGDLFKNQKIIYWLFVILMLMGKEEVGAILCLASVFLFFKNKKLAVQTFIISFLWFFISFFVIIPRYANLRQQSITTFAEKTGVEDVNTEIAAGENFFLLRYDYLGESYAEIAKNLLIKPGLVFKVVFTEDKLQAIRHILGPLGYVVISVPLWLVSLPDLAIVLLSKDEIFEISNHRIAFVIASLFVSYVYFLSFLNSKFLRSRFVFFKKKYQKVLVIGISLLILINTIYYSDKVENPLFVSGKSFLQNKIISRVFAKNHIDTPENKYKLGFTRSAKVPRNPNECLKEMAQLIKEKNPNIYTGPDYLGAQASLRYVNALYPGRYWDSDLVIADLYDMKTMGPLEAAIWTYNKESLRLMMDTGNFKHLYSCGKMFAFEKGQSTDMTRFIESQRASSVVASDEKRPQSYELKTKKVSLEVFPVSIPSTISREDTKTILLILTKRDGDFDDKVTFFRFESVKDPDLKYSFIDYLAIGSREGLDVSERNQAVLESYNPKLSPNMKSGKYSLFFGVGDLLDASEMYVGEVLVVDTE